MPHLTLSEEASRNYHSFSANSYPGRLVLAGRNASGSHFVLATAMTSRSEPNRNRLYEKDDATGLVKPAVADENKPAGGALTVYNAMRESGRGFHVASNGEQTDIVEQLSNPSQFAGIMRSYSYEPDLSSTPRITALLGRHYGGGPLLQLSILRKSPFDNSCERALWSYETLERGFSHCLRTYERDSDEPNGPPPPFRGQPTLLPLDETPQEVLDMLWFMLCPENRIAVAVKFIDVLTGKSQVELANRYEKKAKIVAAT